MQRESVRGGVEGGAGLVFGSILLSLGMLFLVGQLLGIGPGRILWPFFIIVPGLAFFVGMVAGGRGAGGLAIPGSIVTTVGLLLLYQNAIGHWVSWAYGWALVPMAVGIGLMIHGSWSDSRVLRESGRRVATIGVVLFLVFGAFFELVLNVSGYWRFGQWLWPVLLIAVGVFLLLRRDPDVPER